jgi:hypothetical protein
MGHVRDWVEWHRDYDDPSSALSSRLECVKRRPLFTFREKDDQPANHEPDTPAQAE